MITIRLFYKEKRFFLYLATLLASLITSSHGNKREKEDPYLLFLCEKKIPKENKTIKIFILGTMHYGNDDDYPLPTHIEQAYKLADAIMIELVISKQSRASFFEKESPFSFFFQKNDIEQIKQWLAPYKLSSKEENWLFSAPNPHTFLSRVQSLINKKELGQNLNGFDDYFTKRAIQDGKPLVSLESPIEQLAMISRLGNEYMRKYCYPNRSTSSSYLLNGRQSRVYAISWFWCYLFIGKKQFFKDLTSMITHTKRIVRLTKRFIHGEFDLIEKVIENGDTMHYDLFDKEAKPFSQLLIKKRDENMTQRIITICNSMNESAQNGEEIRSFVVVGAAHLPGILDLLATEHQFKIKRIKK